MRDPHARTKRRRQAIAERLRLSLAMQSEGLAMKRLSLERRFPGASPAEIERRLGEWLLDRPLDAPGFPVRWQRQRPR